MSNGLKIMKMKSICHGQWPCFCFLFFEIVCVCVCVCVWFLLSEIDLLSGCSLSKPNNYAGHHNNPESGGCK